MAHPFVICVHLRLTKLASQHGSKHQQIVNHPELTTQDQRNVRPVMPGRVKDATNSYSAWK
jgi:hypothetical protein